MIINIDQCLQLHDIGELCVIVKHNLYAMEAPPHEVLELQNFLTHQSSCLKIRMKIIVDISTALIINYNNFTSYDCKKKHLRPSLTTLQVMTVHKKKHHRPSLHHTHALMCACTHIHVHVCVCMRARTHTHAHTHTHIL